MANWINKLSKMTSNVGRGNGRDGSMAAARAASSSSNGGGPGDIDFEEVAQRRHSDWRDNELRWRFLQDSYEGGQRYRNAVYGSDRKGLPCRNLFRHRREYPDPQQYPNNYVTGFPNILATADSTASMVAGGVGGSGIGPWPGQLGADPGATALDDEYELRRARTPPPEWVAECVGIHQSKIFDQEVHRDGPADIEAWWLDVDGRGTPIDDWMKETFAPLFGTLGCLDVCFDHPAAPPGVTIRTKADEREHGLDKCVASYILPENMLWWRVDQAERYLECLVREYVDPADRCDYDDDGHAIDTSDPDENSDGAKWRRSYIRLRLWSATESILFSYEGDEILERTPHAYGRVPIVRLIDQKKHRTPNVGKSRYEAIAEYQRAFYNLDSELIFSNSLQAHASLSGPVDYCKAGNTLTVGPGNILPMIKIAETGAYQGWEYVCPGKDPADSLRKDKDDLTDLKDRAACLTKPAGATGKNGGGAGTVSQSGLSKQLDGHTGHKQLTSISRSFAKAERTIAEFASVVIRGRDPTPAERAAINVVYPAKFDLYSTADLIESLNKIQLGITAAGQAPLFEGRMFAAIQRQVLLGLTDAEYEELDDEMEVVLAAKAQIVEHGREMQDAGISSSIDALTGDGSDDGGEADPAGEAGGTAVSGAVIAAD